VGGRKGETLAEGERADLLGEIGGKGKLRRDERWNENKKEEAERSPSMS